MHRFTNLTIFMHLAVVCKWLERMRTWNKCRCRRRRLWRSCYKYEYEIYAWRTQSMDFCLYRLPNISTSQIISPAATTTTVDEKREKWSESTKLALRFLINKLFACWIGWMMHKNRTYWQWRRLVFRKTHQFIIDTAVAFYVCMLPRLHTMKKH